jgi:AcrR family transcriptional regulator
VERTRRVVRRAVLDVLAQGGWAAYSIDAVATASGVARSTIYRHWPDKVRLLVDALEDHSEQPEPPPLGSARDRVVDLVRHLTEVMGEPVRSPQVPALIDASERDPTVRAVHHAFAARRRAALTAALADAGVRDPELVARALAGAVLYSRVMTDEPLSPSRAVDLVDAVVGPLPGEPVPVGV